VSWLLNLAVRIFQPLLELVLFFVGKPILAYMARPVFRVEGRSYKREGGSRPYREFRVTLRNRRAVSAGGPFCVHLELQGGSWVEGEDTKLPAMTVLHGPTRVGTPPRIELCSRSRGIIHVGHEMRPMASWTIICRTKASATGLSLWLSSERQAPKGEPAILVQAYAPPREITGFSLLRPIRTPFLAMLWSAIPIFVVMQVPDLLASEDLLFGELLSWSDYAWALAISCYYALIAFSMYYASGESFRVRQACGFVGDDPATYSEIDSAVLSEQSDLEPASKGDKGAGAATIEARELFAGAFRKAKQALQVSRRSGLLLTLLSTFAFAIATLSLFVGFRLQQEDQRAGQTFARTLLHSEQETRMATRYPGPFALVLPRLQGIETKQEWPDEVERLLREGAEKLGSAARTGCAGVEASLHRCNFESASALGTGLCTETRGRPHMVFVPPTMLKGDDSKDLRAADGLASSLRNAKRMCRAVAAAVALTKFSPTSAVGDDTASVLPERVAHAYFVSADGAFAILGKSRNYGDYWLRYHEQHPLPRWEARPYVLPFHRASEMTEIYRSKTYIDIGGLGLVRTYCRRVRGPEYRSIGILCVDEYADIGLTDTKGVEQLDGASQAPMPFASDHVFDYWRVDLPVTSDRVNKSSLSRMPAFSCMEQALDRYDLDEIIDRGGIVTYARDRDGNCMFDGDDEQPATGSCSRSSGGYCEYLILLSKRPEQVSFILVHPTARVWDRDSSLWLTGALLLMWIALTCLGLGQRRSLRQLGNLERGAPLRDVPFGVVELDPEGRVVAANDRAEEILACPLHYFDDDDLADGHSNPEACPVLGAFLDEAVLPLAGDGALLLQDLLRGQEAQDGFVRLFGRGAGPTERASRWLRFVFLPPNEGAAYFVFDRVEDPVTAETLDARLPERGEG
jgi:PAS domain-containing protein